MPSNGDFARVAAKFPVIKLEQRSLARAIASDNSDPLAAPDVEVDAIQSAEAHEKPDVAKNAGRKAKNVQSLLAEGA